MNKFKLQSQYKPAGDQNKAITQLVNGLKNNANHQTLLGVTGSGKTFTMANIIDCMQKPAIIMVHNKTLAAQLFAEFKELFPQNSVSYFVSYYDYYQPEAYVPRKDLYIEKESDINETIERYRSTATQALLTRRDTIIIASVSCIYGLGDPGDYLALSRTIETGKSYKRQKLLTQLADMQYNRSEYDFYPGLYRVRGDTIEIYLFQEDTALRIEFFGDDVESLKLINPITGEALNRPKEYSIFPAKQFVTPFEKLKLAIPQIQKDLTKEVAYFKKLGKKIEAHRLNQRVNYDLEMLQETGYCSGIENYSRYINNRPAGSPPSTLLDYIPDDWLMFIDESHMTVPQIRGMYNGDQARKKNLVDYGFRLKASLDNRPLKFDEFISKLDQTIYVSATPSEYEINKSHDACNHISNYNGVVEQVIRPTGLLDPNVDIRPITAIKWKELKKQLIIHNYSDMSLLNQKKYTNNQIDDLLIEIKNTINKNQRVLVTTLTKRMSEDLTEYMLELGIKVQYLHSDIDTVERVEILNDLRLGTYDVVVGINLLREGLDLPEVTLVAILDADKEGFLRSKSSLVQTIGRASRHSEGRVIMYADKITGSMKYAVDETIRRRNIQTEFNKKNNIIPKTIQKKITQVLKRDNKQKQSSINQNFTNLKKNVDAYPAMTTKEKRSLKRTLETEMSILADMLKFEDAAKIRDLLNDITSN